MSTGDEPPSIDPRYAAAQLVASLRAAAGHGDPVLRAKAERRAEGWLAVLRNLASDVLRIGQRQPFADVPAWVTPSVLRGGFASGALAAGGPLLAHETALARVLGVEEREDARATLNGFHLTPAGLESLGRDLVDRSYRVRVPEEGALLVVKWLIDRGELASAAALVETIAPFFDRVRFYPQPGAPVGVPEPGLATPVLRKTAHELAASLRRKKPSPDIETMRESVEVWAPMTDALVTLLLATVDGEPPRFEGEAPERRLVGGRPFARRPEGFEERRRELLTRLADARRTHRRCLRPHRRGEVLERLAEGLSSMPGPLDGLAVRVRERLAGFVTAYGVPGSPEHARLRASQRVGPSHALVGHVVADRIERTVRPGDGLADPTSVTGSIGLAEAAPWIPAGTAVPPMLASRVETAREAPLPVLVERGLVASGEVMATLLPQVTGAALATRFEDPAARTLYAATYRAFRARRSVLLLWLQHQVRLGELPWVAALEACSDVDPTAAVRDTLRALAALAITAFPGTITPNKLVSELSALGAAAGLVGEPERPALPLVEEVASDIFMGTFTVKFLRAAQLAARLLRPGSIYVRYYGLDPARVLRMEHLVERGHARTSPDFDAYCLELAALPAGGNPRARNGAMIEQASILTTHNLAALVGVLDLEPLLADRWIELAQRAFVSVLDRLERRVLPERVPTIQRMRASKTLAFAWRQMLFFLSLADPAAVAAFVTDAHGLLAERTDLARDRFAPVMTGLAHVARGGTLDSATSGARRLLGWSLERPFLMGAHAASA